MNEWMDGWLNEWEGAGRGSKGNRPCHVPQGTCLVVLKTRSQMWLRACGIDGSTITEACWMLLEERVSHDLRSVSGGRGKGTECWRQSRCEEMWIKEGCFLKRGKLGDTCVCVHIDSWFREFLGPVFGRRSWQTQEGNWHACSTYHVLGTVFAVYSVLNLYNSCF